MANVSSSIGISKYPKLRFPGFDDPWERTPFSNLYRYVSEKNDGSFSVEQIISVANMYFKADARITDKDYLRTYNVFKFGDIAFEGNKNKNFAYGRFVENTIGDGIVSHVFVVFRPVNESHNLEYWKYAINNENVMGRILARCTKKTTMMTNLVASDFLAQTIYCPSLDEQAHIATFLSLIDERIRKQEELIEAIGKYRRGLLRTIFLEKPALLPIETADNLKIEEVCDVLSGKRIPKGETFSSQPTEYRYITVSDMGEKYVRSDTLQYITSHTEKQISRYKVKDGDIIISVAGTLGKLNIITSDLEGVNLTENCDRFTNFRRINPEYLYYVLSSDLIQVQIKASKTKNGQPKLALERIRNFTIPVPERSTQEKLVCVMNAIDRQIAFHKAINEKYYAMRAGLLQQLFI